MSERNTPFSLFFEQPGTAAEYFPRIAAELDTRDSFDRDSFFTSSALTELMREVAPETGEGSAQMALLVYHAFSYWRAGQPTWAIEDAALRTLLSGPSLGPWPLAPPSPAGYLQLPRHRLFVPGQGNEPAEPVDGFFWVAGTSPSNALDVLLVLGLHAGRSGITVVELASGPLPAHGHWGDLEVRGGGEDFASVLPGGEQLLGLTTAGEVLKLVSRTFWHVQSDGSVRDRAGSGGDR